MYKDDCIFCKFAKGEVETRVIMEDDKHMAFLSHRPNTEGFTVVIPRDHHDSYIANVPDDVTAEFMAFTSRVCKFLDSAFEDVGRTGLMFEGFGVDHLHAKLFPMHGTRADKWEARHSDTNKYFDKYEGYISSHDFGEPGRKEVDETWKKLKATKK
jgi:histidine triad (HIT) family protein